MRKIDFLRMNEWPGCCGQIYQRQTFSHWRAVTQRALCREWGRWRGAGGADGKQEKQRLDVTGLRGDGDKGRRTNLLPAFHLEKKKKISPQTRRHESIGGKRSQSQTILQVLGADRRSCIPQEEQEEALSSQPGPGPISEEP